MALEVVVVEFDILEDGRQQHAIIDGIRFDTRGFDTGGERRFAEAAGMRNMCHSDTHGFGGVAKLKLLYLAG